MRVWGDPPERLVAAIAVPGVLPDPAPAYDLDGRALFLRVIELEPLTVPWMH